MVIWVTGLACSGKSSLGKMLFSMLKKEMPATVLLDGDEIRSIFKSDNRQCDYSPEAREKLAWKYHEICSWLEGQKINVVCCTIGGTEKIRQANREEFSKYYEILVTVPFELLLERDTKNLYAPALEGKLKDVVGVDIPFSAPQNPDYTFENTIPQSELASVAEDILARVMEAKSV